MTSSTTWFQLQDEIRRALRAVEAKEEDAAARMSTAVAAIAERLRAEGHGDFADRWTAKMIELPSDALSDAARFFAALAKRERSQAKWAIAAALLGGTLLGAAAVHFTRRSASRALTNG